jgi:hypothetical protein
MATSPSRIIALLLLFCVVVDSDLVLSLLFPPTRDLGGESTAALQGGGEGCGGGNDESSSLELGESCLELAGDGDEEI